MQVQPYEVSGWGVGELWLQEATLVYHELPRAAAKPVAGARKEPALLELVVAYFAGEPVSFDEVELELDWCTPFQRAVADALRRVPYGETVTYGELAIAAGYPNTHRAAGTFCAGNRFPLVLPCHRVVSAAGIGPYGSLGSDYKRRLLALEGVPLGAL
ncbi:MAG TPA: methylated-DNA--[protein]-cysteine S-methyltransferase [Gaiellaceae bacterium]|nr:methylated-DNA--[protein]-cysteine S-methyltransferase [Gaiellaceae bacterium]